jgi:multidrug efflux pump subunit AcrA (membrane-fusion protein)
MKSIGIVLIISSVLLARDYDGIIFPVRDVLLSTRAGGVVVAIPFHEGEAVDAGAVLLAMDNRKDSLQNILAQRDLEKSRIQKTNEVESEVQVALRRITLEELTIRAPFAGIIAKIEAKEFEYYPPGSKAIKLVDIANLITEIYVDRAQLDRVRKLKSGITVFVGNQTTNGTFAGYNPQAEPGVGLFQVKIRFANKFNWFPGTSVSVSF